MTKVSQPAVGKDVAADPRRSGAILPELRTALSILAHWDPRSEEDMRGRSWSGLFRVRDPLSAPTLQGPLK